MLECPVIAVFGTVSLALCEEKNEKPPPPAVQEKQTPQPSAPVAPKKKGVAI